MIRRFDPNALEALIKRRLGAMTPPGKGRGIVICYQTELFEEYVAIGNSPGSFLLEYQRSNETLITAKLTEREYQSLFRELDKPAYRQIGGVSPGIEELDGESYLVKYIDERSTSLVCLVNPRECRIPQLLEFAKVLDHALKFGRSKVPVSSRITRWLRRAFRN